MDSSRISDIVARIVASSAMNAVRPNLGGRLQNIYQQTKGTQTAKEFQEMIEAIRAIPTDIRDRLKIAARTLDRQFAMNPTTRGPWASLKEQGGKVQQATSSFVSPIVGVIGTGLTNGMARFRLDLANLVAGPKARQAAQTVMRAGYNILPPSVAKSLSQAASRLSSVSGKAWQAIMYSPTSNRIAGAAGTLLGRALRLPFAAANMVPGAGRAMLRGTGAAVGMVAPRMGASIARLGMATGAAGAVTGLGAVAAAAVALPPILKAWGDSLVEGQRNIAQYNAAIAGQVAISDAQSIMRNVGSGAKTQESAVKLLEAQSRLQDALQGPLDEISIATNKSNTLLANILTAVINSSGVEAIAKRIREAILGAAKEEKPMFNQDPLIKILHDIDIETRNKGGIQAWKPNREPLPPIK